MVCLQVVLLPNLAVTAPSPAADGSLFLASASFGGIRQLKPIPLERQARLLAAAGDFQGALELLTLLEEEEVDQGTSVVSDASSAAGEVVQTARSTAASRRQQLEDVLRLRFGYHLFEGMQLLATMNSVMQNTYTLHSVSASSVAGCSDCCFADRLLVTDCL